MNKDQREIALKDQSIEIDSETSVQEINVSRDFLRIRTPARIQS